MAEHTLNIVKMPQGHTTNWHALHSHAMDWRVTHKVGGGCHGSRIERNLPLTYTEYVHLGYSMYMGLVAACMAIITVILLLTDKQLQRQYDQVKDDDYSYRHNLPG